ncbi:MAG: hypothetical protein ACKOC0_05930 [Cytophagales bacterium]
MIFDVEVFEYQTNTSMKTTPPLQCKIAETFFKVDDFCRFFEKELAAHRLPRPSDAKKGIAGPPFANRR